MPVCVVFAMQSFLYNISLEVYFERLSQSVKVYDAAKDLSEIVPEQKAVDNDV